MDGVIRNATVGRVQFPWLHAVLNMEAFCNPEYARTYSNQSDFSKDLKKIEITFGYIQLGFCIIGVIGNILNLRTLQSPALQTVPFMYIRSLAVFDLISLSCILFHFLIVNWKNSLPLMMYRTYVEAPLINTFLVAGLYCAFLLTVERYLLLSRPHTKPSKNPRPRARRKIMLMLFFSLCLHVPMMLQSTLRLDKSGTYNIINNVAYLCSEPMWTAFSYYKLARECFRFFCVVVMTVLNVVIARKLQITKMRRRRLVRRSSPSETENHKHNTAQAGSSPEPVSAKKEYTSLIKSFTEKKLTVLMIAICFIFILGNVPQMIVMVLQNEAMEHVFGFQVYRYCSNLLEVVNHCLNFYVFCMASSEYGRAFLLNCMCLRNLLLRFPSIADYIMARRSSSFLATSSGGLGMHNRDYMSMESLQDGEKHCYVVSQECPMICINGTETNLKGILVTGNRENRKKKGLTIVNHVAASSPMPERKEERPNLRKCNL